MTLTAEPAPPGPSEYEALEPRVAISIVVPAFNEAENIPLLHSRLAPVLQRLAPDAWELILVDDGSRDLSWAVICGISAEDPRVMGVRLSRNFGHQYALWAGLERSTGQAVVMMDCDLQHPVETLEKMVAQWRAGYKVVKTQRQDEAVELGWFKRWTSRNFYRLFSYLSGVNLQPGLADFRLLDRQALRELLRFKEEGLFLRGLTEWIGFPSCTIPYAPAQRIHGRSGYSLKKMIKLAWNGVSSFSTTPLRIGIFIGLAGSLVSVIGVVYAFFGHFFGRRTVPGWASTLIVISLLFCLLFVYLGILGEYIARMVVEVRQRPRYVVSETAGFRKPNAPPYE
jgi:dolichol-phosphate mannosyltransferase